MDVRVEIREAVIDDAEGMVVLNRLLSQETCLMLMEPDELPASTESQQQTLQRMVSSEDEQMIVAVAGSRLVGFVAASRKRFKRVRHCFGLVIGVEKSYWGRGVGRRLMGEIERWARSNGAERLELTVLEDNERAIHLYRHCGFVVEGIRRKSMRIDSKLADELYMSKLLS